MNNDPSNLGEMPINETLFYKVAAGLTDFLDRHPRPMLMVSALGIAASAACAASGTPASQESSSMTTSFGVEASPTETTTTPPTSETTVSPEASRYPAHTVVATVFNLGEVPSPDNAYISNTETSWDSSPVDRFGGVDNPEERTAEGLPTGFTPRHNPFYFALPASEFTAAGLIEGARESSPWTDEQIGDEDSLFKGRWIRVTRGDMTVYAQWIDCGPSDDPEGARDYGYVFGPSDAIPENQFGLKAGLDLSPTAAFHLGFGVEEGGAEVTWQFIDSDQVPEGPWTESPAIDNRTYWE